MCGITLTRGTWTLRHPARWWGHWSQWECLWNACWLTADWRQGTVGWEEGRKGGVGLVAGVEGVHDRFMWGWRRRRKKTVQRLVSCEPEAVSVYVTERTQLSLKKFVKGGGGVKAIQPGKSHKAENISTWQKSLFLMYHVQYVSVIIWCPMQCTVMY